MITTRTWHITIMKPRSPAKWSRWPQTAGTRTSPRLTRSWRLRSAKGSAGGRNAAVGTSFGTPPYLSHMDYLNDFVDAVIAESVGYPPRATLRGRPSTWNWGPSMCHLIWLFRYPQDPCGPRVFGIISCWVSVQSSRMRGLIGRMLWFHKSRKLPRDPWTTYVCKAVHSFVTSHAFLLLHLCGDGRGPGPGPPGPHGPEPWGPGLGPWALGPGPWARAPGLGPRARVPAASERFFC